jgi:hypothetical protein
MGRRRDACHVPTGYSMDGRYHRRVVADDTWTAPGTRT